MNEKSIFQTMSEVDVSDKVRQKGQFWYVSWSNAVRELLKKYPDANWTFTKYGDDGLPYLKTDAGCFVECTVVVGSISRTQMLPVLDFKNKSVVAPDSTQINKSQMRALTKAIALHGFGLDLWAGEDLDQAGDDDAVSISYDDMDESFRECLSVEGANDLFEHYGKIATDKKDRQMYIAAKKLHKARVNEIQGVE